MCSKLLSFSVSILAVASVKFEHSTMSELCELWKVDNSHMNRAIREFFIEFYIVLKHSNYNVQCSVDA